MLFPNICASLSAVTFVFFILLSTLPSPSSEKNGVIVLHCKTLEQEVPKQDRS